MAVPRDLNCYRIEIVITIIFPITSIMIVIVKVIIITTTIIIITMIIILAVSASSLAIARDQTCALL